ncbi:uncharacterized protein LOC106645091 isoform X3 [Copidosoma floridanum]|uniref:uncharacterized protein LOC106645091 isoform X3 n=1 Tax=Copidosoma floridanum TaxID=29053 RepID=UPI0006C9B212|nr:uncharacterized protein LOC106645091 isoform X3 [Copidosoma floridanum]XP_014216346.1 uncharacterized protein LOC106645091 isoform X3 [Copidosoma floridanum]XP_014216347.1 uncharacterized protein LOC106645091 isoform X3 [Copidosoma floridanum]
MALGNLLLLLAVGAAVTSCQGAKRPEATQIDKLRDAVFALEPLDGWFSGRNDPEYQQRHTDELVRVYRDLGNEIDRQFSHLEKKQQQLPLNSPNWEWVNAQAALGTVDGVYLTFRNMLRDAANTGSKQWLKFARTVLGRSDEAVAPALEKIARAIVQGNIFVSAYQEASLQICDTQQSPQQLLYNLYNTIALTEVKGYTMMQFSWALLKLYNIGNFTEETEQLKQQYAIRTSETLRAIKTAMAFAPRELWKCDPSVHKRDVTYTELKQLFQGFIVNEVDLNSQGTCKENCGYYSYSKVYGCFKNKFCARQRRCNGKILNCQYVDSDMWVCPSARYSDRRYDSIEYENGVKYGSADKCLNPTKVDSWWRWIFWHCSYCMCTCDDHNANSERYFNLRDVTSDVSKNMVVTGVRLKKVNQVVHIQIQEGRLMPHGNIDATSVVWKPVDNYTIVDAGVRSGIDYHTIMWEKRAVDLDDLDAPEDHLMTGLRFRLVGAHLNLEIRVTPFNFSTGELAGEKSLWHSHDATEASEVYDYNGETRVTTKRTELKINDPDIPTRSSAQSVPDSKSNQFLLFTPTDLKKDVAQNTVPFIDIQPVEPKPPVPIAGCGIFHKGREGYGGFLALKLITYNFEPKLRSDMPPAPPLMGMSNDVNAM